VQSINKRPLIGIASNLIKYSQVGLKSYDAVWFGIWKEMYALDAGGLGIGSPKCVRFKRLEGHEFKGALRVLFDLRLNTVAANRNVSILCRKVGKLPSLRGPSEQGKWLKVVTDRYWKIKCLLESLSLRMFWFERNVMIRSYNWMDLQTLVNSRKKKSKCGLILQLMIILFETCCLSTIESECGEVINLAVNIMDNCKFKRDWLL
jgi:hypothetical protein